MGSEDQGSSRLDTLEIKSLIFREFGHQRAESYFNQLGRFFALKITKSEFDKFCIKTIGRQSIHLHNRLIRSIIKNASVAKSPPSRFTKKAGDFARFGSGDAKTNQSHSLYGDSAFSPSTRKCRSRKFRDRPSPLGPLGKPQSLTTTNEESMSKAQSATELLSLGSRPPVEVASVEEGEEVEQMAGGPSVQIRSPVTAPLGVSMSLRNGATRKSISNVSMCSSSFNHETCENSGELPDTRTLRSRLERRLEMEGIKITMDSVSLLNSGLDAFMRRLIQPCLSLANTRCGNERIREMNYQYTQQSRRLSYVSMSDFRAGMELNPQILGEDWPILLEKICSRASDK
ncbi:hypothetical protein CARUB_v10005174mg [Capsella rubella]|uniref:Plant heme peroxidase family profile domain-containing protein n=1 Tax=Capsella rubella TaxID=81985 RepID=R0GJB0_9BRAS|nr:uncharacterized protein LOC17879196 [Capsella rubella]XP_006284047.1 uncharacterized protein LOC17879196 [Capsella rubella]EOA16944.1 hypothetical protein CARUB_v10005174mg [Capsella rubella]EOA16945.1 hypothetical protein CARUB_v10005174mg [Capsella rubella]